MAVRLTVLSVPALESAFIASALISGGRWLSDTFGGGDEPLWLTIVLSAIFLTSLGFYIRLIIYALRDVIWGDPDEVKKT